MHWFKKLLFIIATLSCASYVAAQEFMSPLSENTLGNSVGKSDTVVLDVYKSPSCQCCSKWIHHVEAFNFEAETHHPDNITLVKERVGVPKGYYACHTSVTKDGRVFEGHIPAKLIRRYLMKQPKDTIGLTVKGMPLGSPGMNVGGRFSPYKIYLIHKNGSVSEYEDVKLFTQQYDIE